MQPGEGPEAYHWITLRAGNSAGTITLNGSAAARQFGGRMVSFIEIHEIMV